MKPQDERYDTYIARKNKEANKTKDVKAELQEKYVTKHLSLEVSEKLPGIINLMSQNIITNLAKIRHLEERIKILEQRNLHSAQNNNY